LGKVSGVIVPSDIRPSHRDVFTFPHDLNGEHRHSAIRFVTPDEHHCGREHGILDENGWFHPGQRFPFRVVYWKALNFNEKFLNW
jgi:hypothetical protein